MPTVISNASPLIALSGIGQLNLLQKLWDEIIIPEAVYRETVIDGAGKPGAKIIAAACKQWIKVIHVKNVLQVKVLRAMFG